MSHFSATSHFPFLTRPLSPTRPHCRQHLTPLPHHLRKLFFFIPFQHTRRDAFHQYSIPGRRFAQVGIATRHEPVVVLAALQLGE